MFTQKVVNSTKALIIALSLAILPVSAEDLDEPSESSNSFQSLTSSSLSFLLFPNKAPDDDNPMHDSPEILIEKSKPNNAIFDSLVRFNDKIQLTLAKYFPAEKLPASAKTQELPQEDKVEDNQHEVKCKLPK